MRLMEMRPCRGCRAAIPADGEDNFCEECLAYYRQNADAIAAAVAQTDAGEQSLPSPPAVAARRWWMD